MKIAVFALVGAICLGLAPLTAAAQPAPALPEDPGGAIVEELVVQAKEPGPAWWVVSDGDSTVYILGMPPGTVPKDMAWDRSWLDRRLAGANSLILADTVKIKVGISSLGAAYRLYKTLRPDQPLEARLQEPLRSRFVAARQSIGQPAGRYSDWSVFMASMMLVTDAEPAGWIEPRDDIIRAARKAKVRRTELPAIDASKLLPQMFDSLDARMETACMAAAVTTVERARPREVARGWADGDVAAAISGPRDYEGCVLLLSGGAQIWRSAVSGASDLIAAALKTPGRSVALVDLSMLVAEEGVIRKLEARGLTVTGPGGS